MVGKLVFIDIFRPSEEAVSPGCGKLYPDMSSGVRRLALKGIYLACLTRR